jgi:hypothetical protein
MSKDNFLADIVCGGGVAFDDAFLSIREPEAIQARYKQIFDETTLMQCHTLAQRIIDICKHRTQT